jgi:hypothetical protein
LDTDGTETETLSTSSSLTVTIRPGSTPIRGPDSPLGWLKQHVPSVVSDLQGSQHGNDFMQLIDGRATFERGGAFGGNVRLDTGANATLKIDHTADFSGDRSRLRR